MTIPPWRGADKMAALKIEKYAIKTKLYGQMYGHYGERMNRDDNYHTGFG